MEAKATAKQAQKDRAKAAKMVPRKAKRIIGPIISSGWDFFEAIYYGGTVTEGFLKGTGTFSRTYFAGYLGEERNTTYPSANFSHDQRSVAQSRNHQDGLSVATTGTISAAGFVVLTTTTLAKSMVARQGPIAMAAHQICLHVWLAVSLITDVLATSGKVLIASSVSEGDYRSVKDITYFMLTEDFDEFEDVDMLYNTLSLDKLEALEDLVIMQPLVMCLYSLVMCLGEGLDGGLNGACTKACKWILGHGSVTTIPSWGKTWHSILGVCGWEGTNPMAPEFWHLPSLLPMYPG
ncbi:unnamed protein product [Lactuca saligna]|uniref:Uncharacterized protein n=1 Tax=Lactuca saligna TaxID=75948 RepID=A0AA35Z0A0_LACSI|nr:unnamed protein product [Lactuca saligna]